MNKDSLFVYEEDGFCELKYSFKDLKRLERKNQKLHNNWNELKKWLEEQENYFRNECEATKNILVYRYFRGAKNAIGDTLNKMNELEKGEE